MEESPSRGSASPVAEILTPRTKVARMLADIDDAPTPSPARFTTTAIEAPPPRSSPPSLKRNTRNGVASAKVGPFQAETDSDTDDDNDDAVRRPAGRAARRMLGHAGSDSPSHRTNRESMQQSSPPMAVTSEAVRSVHSDDELYSTTPMRPVPTALSTIRSERSAALFVSPAKSTQHESDGDELPSNPLGSKQKLAELVAKKREERLQREKEEREHAERSKKRKHQRSPDRDASSDLPDEMLEGSQEAASPDIDRIMSDASRPTRKASKKALLEMERETQRLARQQALAHQMKVKKKFTTNDLFARFNFRQQLQTEAAAEDVAGDTTASSAPNSDAVEGAVDGMVREPVSTPPSSPPTAGPTPLDKQKAIVERGALSKLMLVREDTLTSIAQHEEDEELLDIADVITSSQRPQKTALPETATPGKKGFKLARLGKKAVIRRDDSSDDDLDIVAPLPKHLRAFDMVSAKPKKQSTFADSKAIHNLRHLSHIGAYESLPRKPGKPGLNRAASVNPQILEAQLRKKAKEQARQQQAERIAELKAKGVEILTTEEREKEQEVFENLLEKARQEAEELRKAEKAALKAQNDDVNVQVSDDQDEDEEYVASGDEDEEMEGGEEDEDEEEEDAEDGLVDEAAEESEDEGSDESEHGEVLNDVEGHENQVVSNAVTPAPKQRKSRQSRIVQDDDDDDEIEGDHVAVAPTPSNRKDDPFAAFNFDAANSVSSLLSPTQAFQATMQTPSQATQEESFDILRRIAPPSASSLLPTIPSGYGESQFEMQDEEAPADVVLGSQSQVPESQRISLNWETQPAPETPKVGTLTRDASRLTETPGWEPTQDGGLPSPWTAPGGRLQREDTMDSVTEDGHETQETVPLRISESPAPSAFAQPRKGRLTRRQAALVDSSDDDEAPAASAKTEKRDAFREMARRRTEALTAAERAEAELEAKRMMDEQAEESEDEYAGLGGDDYVAPETEQDREMIDSSHVDVDERALAAHYAERERVRQEAETSKLYKDLTTGALRRKQANMFDLDEDEDEVAMRRRQMKQREEARKRKLLLQDDNIAGLAEGKQSKGKDAFLKAIADDDDGDDVLDLSDGGEDDSAPATQQESRQSQQQTEHAQPLRGISGNKRSLALEESDAEQRPPAKMRRTQASAFRKPASMMEVRESLSFLLDEPETFMAGPTALDQDSEPEDEEADQTEELEDDDDDDEVEAEHARQNDGGFAPNPADFDAKAMPPPRLPASQRRTGPKPAVVDRLSLKRGSSATDSALGRTAWAAGPTTGGFKVPSLLRRATTSIAAAAGNDRGVTTRDFSREGSGVKMGGSKKSNLAYQARAEERRAIVEASAKRRAENTARIAQMRRSSSGMMSKGLTGQFE